MIAPVAGRCRPPRVWLIQSYRAGENSQLLALAEALDWPFEIKRLVYRSWGFLVNLTRRVSLAGIDRSRSSPLQAPWPDVVIAAGLRNEPVARWIRRQSGGRVKLVHIGRPWADLRHFDLVITTPQYRLPPRPNVLHNALTLQRVTADHLAEATAFWAPRLAALPRPYITVLAGGNSGPYTFDPSTAERLGQAANALAMESGGSLLVTSSARTPRPSFEVLAATLQQPAYLYHWTPDDSENPYYGLLALADALIVTSDSIAMLTEACATCKPVYIFDMGAGPGDRPWTPAHWASFGYRQLLRFGPRKLGRDVGLVHRALIDAERAVWLGQTFPSGPPPPPLNDVQRAVARVRDLFADEAVVGTADGAEEAMPFTRSAEE
ncbi:MAG TPA: mitochondrial fission ELM1 family protein [Candidatus Competibacteraceae bacterium]|nr:mitochondrial fission ELM1 family protein [Candidatus Competibacteraceae bacterium]